MSATVCLWANTIGYPHGGGHLWVYLNWALGLRSCGCEVIWIESVDEKAPAASIEALVVGLRMRLAAYGFSSLALCPANGPLDVPVAPDCLPIEAAAGADLLLDMGYNARADVTALFRGSALLDIDPGLTQIWIRNGDIRPASRDLYFTIGETVGRPGSRIPDCGLAWIYTPPCVALEQWPVKPSAKGAPYTTVSQWDNNDWLLDEERSYENTKRSGFLPFLDLPRRSAAPLELALDLGGDDEEKEKIVALGWAVRDARVVAATPDAYQAYIQRSRGEFSCVKPSCVELQNAWISDRSLCYLASGKPVVVRHTGPSRFLPDADGLLRFRDLDEAVARLADAEANHDRHARAARALAEEFFDATKVAKRVLERALA